MSTLTTATPWPETPAVTRHAAKPLPPPGAAVALANPAGSTLSAVRRRASAWYREHRRDLPWRQDQDPYAVWVSELMLQQTQVATVIPYFNRWMKRFPTVTALCNATEDDVLHAWQGLGYYRRARALHAGAKQIQEKHRGRVPRDLPALLALPGVGPYTAGAIASIAYQEPVPIVDGNVSRVLCRLFAQRGDPTKAPVKEAVWTWAERLVQGSEPRTFNQAMMELGATVCRPAMPRCEQCPVQSVCAAKRRGVVDDLPETPKRPTATRLTMAAAVVLHQNQVLVSRRSENAARWAGLWEFPQTEVRQGESSQVAAGRAVKEATGLTVRVSRKRAALVHTVTRYRVTLNAHPAEPERLAPRSATKGQAKYRFIPTAGLDELAMSSPQRKLARWVEQGKL